MFKMTYILYVAQQANFQSRTMLIPIEEFLKVRQEDYNLLKQYATKQTFKLDKDYTANVLYIHYEQQTNYNTVQVDSPYLKVVNELTHYADGMDHYDDETNTFENCYFTMKDKIWYDLAVTNLCRGCNHIQNYQDLLNKYPTIVDSFLVLHSDDPKIKIQL